jgi:two-component sensor histidine kinase
VLTSERWEGADLHDVVAAVLAPHGGAQAGRFRVAGPPVRLLPKAALALAMGLHELATNAREYGALSPDAAGGQVSLIWSTRHGRLRLVWSEQGGPPVTRPFRKGFGTRLVERSLAQDLGGKVAVAFRPGGVICTLDAPLVDAAAHAEVPPLPQVGSVGA